MIRKGRLGMKSGRGHLFIYVLLILRKKPMSGYEIIKTITQNSNGKWTPSKGALYPLLEDMENKRIIKHIDTGKRGKRVYRITNEGERIILEIKKHKMNIRKKLSLVGPIILELLPKKERDTMKIAFEIHGIVLEKLERKQTSVNRILDDCLKKLKRV
ncbi:PadR family transcriptional regulator [Candidatus Micrarchaeota archaeon]|nr:PadR family transcriptional regulator [Candidatus Micrarchaeota archaeon]